MSGFYQTILNSALNIVKHLLSFDPIADESHLTTGCLVRQVATPMEFVDNGRQLLLQFVGNRIVVGSITFSEDQQSWPLIAVLWDYDFSKPRR